MNSLSIENCSRKLRVSVDTLFFEAEWKRFVFGAKSRHETRIELWFKNEFWLDLKLVLSFQWLAISVSNEAKQAKKRPEFSWSSFLSHKSYQHILVAFFWAMTRKVLLKINERRRSRGDICCSGFTSRSTESDIGWVSSRNTQEFFLYLLHFGNSGFITQCYLQF